MVDPYSGTRISLDDDGGIYTVFGITFTLYRQISGDVADIKVTAWNEDHIVRIYQESWQTLTNPNNPNDKITWFTSGIGSGGASIYVQPYIAPDPCEDVVCNNICIGTDLYSQKCVDGECITDQLLESNSLSCGYVPPDPCERITCPDFCEGTTKHFNGQCIDGECVYDIIENSTDCGYVSPKEPLDNLRKIIIPIGIGIGLLSLLKIRKK